jgi:CheY-like chemotaxis protein
MPSILIVDDDPVIRALFAEALRPQAEVEAVATGIEALRKIGARKFDLVLLDLLMPVVDGFMVLKVLTEKPGPNKATPVVVITADRSEKTRARAAAAKNVRFVLPKPIEIATLQKLVETTFDQAFVKQRNADAAERAAEEAALAKDAKLVAKDKESKADEPDAKGKSLLGGLFSRGKAAEPEKPPAKPGAPK